MAKLSSLLAVLALVMVPACGDPGSGSVRSGVRGRVVAGPTCPVETQASPCPDTPIAARLTFSPRGGSAVSEITSSADGGFEVRLPPGTYDVNGEPVGGAMFCKPVEVVVEPDAFTSLTFACDTGIR